jgi:hypothetical protein
MKKGQSVTVETFDHKMIDCRLIEVQSQTAIVCSKREWARAAREKREPDCVGWPLASVKEQKRRD